MICAICTTHTYQDLISLSATRSGGKANPLTTLQKYTEGNAVVLFHKPSCPFCFYIKDKFKTVAQRNKNRAQFIMVDITGNDKHYKTQYDFNTVPTVMYFDKGRKVTSHGSINKTVTVADMQKKVDLLKS
jgi:thiol-disulfide isomerase/thioredoxin